MAKKKPPVKKQPTKPQSYPVEVIPLDQIKTDGGTQARSRMRQAAIDRYAEDLGEGAEFPPGRVYRDDAGVNYLARGFHRRDAHQRAGLPGMKCEVRPGGRRDALLDAIGDNAEHGEPRDDQDKRTAVELLLADDEWGKLSTVQVKEAAHVSWTFADKVRKEWDAAHGGTPETRTARDGHQRQAAAPPPPAREVGDESPTLAPDGTVVDPTFPADWSPPGGDVEPPDDDGSLEDEIRDADLGDADRATLASLPPAEDYPIGKVKLDGYNQPIPDNQLPVFATAKAFRGAKQLFGKGLAVLEQLKTDGAPGTEKLSLSSVKQLCQNLMDAIARATPACVCPGCGGTGCEGEPCEGRGWLWSARVPSLANAQRKQLERFVKKVAA